MISFLIPISVNVLKHVQIITHLSYVCPVNQILRLLQLSS